MTNAELFKFIREEGNNYRLTRFIILRALGFVYTIAFLVAINQLLPLIGHHGLTPADRFLDDVQAQLGSRAAGNSILPSLFWLNCSDHALMIVSWAGLLVSVVVLCGYA